MDANNQGGDLEAPKDPGVLKPQSSIVTDTEILGHRHVYVGVHVPGKERSSRNHHHHSRGGRTHRHHRGRQQLKAGQENRPITPPAQRVQFILGEDQNDSSHEPHPLFSEMEELFCDEEGEMEWKETARWVKFEEDVEEGGNRWSKPHVATLSLHSLFELRSHLLNGTVCLDMSANNLDDIAELALDNMINCNQLSYDKKAFVKDAILKKHRHQFEGNQKKDEPSSKMTSNMSKLPIIRSLAEIGRNHSSSKTNPPNDDPKGEEAETKSLPPTEPGTPERFLAVPGLLAGTPAFNPNPEGTDGEMTRNATTSNLDPNESNPDINKKVMNTHFMKKLPKGAEASNILVGELKVLDKPLSAFIRLADSVTLGDLTEVPVPTRFLFILLGPGGETNVQKYHEIGRAVATIMSDEVFHDVAYKAKKREHLLAGIDEFLDAVTVLPPGEWDPSIRIEPPQTVPSQEGRKFPAQKKEEFNEEDEEQKMREQAGLTRTGRLFGGLINDIKRKKPFYFSDFKDALAVQCIASFIFIYFACLTPIITFGGLLGDATENRMAALESLVSGLIVGVTYGFFSGQPLTILGSTGPILVFETILYDFCKGVGWEYLSFRFCIGMWIGIILLILVAVDASAFVCYITRFTEENFATLIAFIFIKKAIEKLIHISDYYPVHPSECYCYSKNDTAFDDSIHHFDFTPGLEYKPHKYNCSFTIDGSDFPGIQSVGCHYHPNAFLMSVLLFIGTFLISIHLKDFKAQNFFPANVRGFISDFAVIIAIVSMTLADYGIGVDTPKLRVPEKFEPTWPGRTWVIHPLGKNPWYSPIVAILPGMLGTILIFMDQQITAVIVNRKEHKLEKGGGYHLDLLIVLILIVVCSIFGLPWFVAATVLSINHVKSLTRESECAAPGEKPQFLGIREQRVTHILIFITIGLSVLMTPLLSIIPMPVLYGVFLYMGVASLKGLQFFDRILLLFMPKKYQPDYPYLRQVPIGRVHMFTAVQFGCLVVLWIIKDIKQTSILFPIMLVVMMGVRKSLDCVFTTPELKILDDILPEFKRKEKLDDEEDDDVDNEPHFDPELAKRRQSLRYTESSVEVEMANGNVLKIPLASNDSDINITEEVNRSGVWTSLEGNTSDPNLFPHHKPAAGKGDGVHRRKKEKRMSIVKEDDDEDIGIQIKIDKPKKNDGTSEENQRLVDNETVV